MESMFLGKMNFNQFANLALAYDRQPRREKEMIGDNVYDMRYLDIPDTFGKCVYKCDNINLWLLIYDTEEQLTKFANAE